MSRQVDKKNPFIPALLDKVLEIIKIKQVDFALECKINPGTLSKAIERTSFSEDIVDKIYDRYGVRKAYWEDGKEPIFEKNGTYVDIPTNNKANGMQARETFYQDLIEKNEEYSILPRAVLKDYKIVPDKIIDVIIKSGENERSALQKSMLMEIESLNEKNKTIIEGYKNGIKILEFENERLKKENEELRRQIPPKD